MAGPAFDPNGAVRFDLRSGAASDGRGARLVLVPAAALEALDGESLARLGAEIGRACGARVASRLGGDGAVRSAPLEVVVSHLAGELAVAGLGALHLERWGRAMVAVLANPAVQNERFLGSALGAALGVASGRELASAAVGRDGGAVRFFVGSKATADAVTRSIADGKSYADVLATLQGARS